MDMTFTTKINAGDVSIDTLFMITECSALKWSVSMEANQSYLKGISASVPDQDIVIRYELEEEDSEGNIVDAEKTISLKDVAVEYDWHTTDRSASLGPGLAPSRIEIYKGKATVTFGTGSI